MPLPATSTDRFSSSVTFRQGPHSVEALEGAMRLANSFSYAQASTYVLFTSPFLRIPDITPIFGQLRIAPGLWTPLSQSKKRVGRVLQTAIH